MRTAATVTAPQPALRGAQAPYERRRPKETTLYQVVQNHVETFLAQVEQETGAGLPQFIKDEFEAFLESRYCGVGNAPRTPSWPSPVNGEAFAPP